MKMWGMLSFLKLIDEIYFSTIINMLSYCRDNHKILWGNIMNAIKSVQDFKEFLCGREVQKEMRSFLRKN